MAVPRIDTLDQMVEQLKKQLTIVVSSKKRFSTEGQVFLVAGVVLKNTADRQVYFKNLWGEAWAVKKRSITSHDSSEGINDKPHGHGDIPYVEDNSGHRVPLPKSSPDYRVALSFSEEIIAPQSKVTASVTVKIPPDLQDESIDDLRVSVHITAEPYLELGLKLSRVVVG